MSIREQSKHELMRNVEKTLDEFKEKYPEVITTPMRDSISKIEGLGIFVLVSAAPEEVSGFCMTIGENTFIFINKNQVVGRQNFSLWHEVYHWFTESTGSVSIVGEDEIDEVEFSADYFASLVLIDKKYLNDKLLEMGFNEDNIKYLSYDQIIELQHHFEVSYAAMVRKIIELYPDSGLSQRYALGTRKRQQDLINRTQNLGFETALIKPTERTYISSELFTILKTLLADSKISQHKVQSLLDFIEKELN